MEKIIKEPSGSWRRYSTDTARKVAEDVERHEVLYRKSTGEYFLHVRTDGERIFPLSVPEAQRWGKARLNACEYDGVFGPVDQAGPKATVAIRLSRAAVARLSDLAAESGSAKSEVVERLIMAAGEKNLR